MPQANCNPQDDLAPTIPVTNENLRKDCRPDENAAKASGPSPGEETLTSETNQISLGHTNPREKALPTPKNKSNLSLCGVTNPDSKLDLPVTPRNKKRQRNNNDRANRKLFANDFFIPFLGDLFNDIQERKLTPLEFCVLAILLRQVDFETGIWTGSAYRIQVGLGFQLNLRTIQEVMKSLVEKRVIKSFHRKGQRNDYQVAIDDYHVRFGRLEGYRLDAGATTDPYHPVYRTDCEATAQRQRNDSATTAKQVRDDCVPTPMPVRSDCAATASPIAGNTPDIPDDIPELPEFLDGSERERTPTTATTTITAERPAKDARTESAVVDDDAAGGGLDISQRPADDGPGISPEPESSKGKPLDRECLMAEIQRTFEPHLFTLKTTSAHRERAFQMAKEHGSALFLAALEHWLVAEPEDTFTVTTGKDLATGEDKEEPKTWLLHEFMETGAALRYIEIVRPFAHVARADLRCFLLTINSEDEPVRVTSQQVAALGQLIEEYDEETMVKAYELADGMEDYLAHGAEYIQQVKDKEDADYVNSVAQTIGCANSDDLKQHKAAFSAAILKLAGQIGRVRAQIAIRKSGPWKGRSLEDFLRFCEEAGKKAGEA